MALFSRKDTDREKWGDRIPPGQKLTEGWPVLHYGSIPKIDLDAWSFEIGGLVEEPMSISWQQYMASPQVNLRNDIHCVTTWSKFDNDWTGVRITDLLKDVKLKPEAGHVMAHSYGGYTTNISIDDLVRPENLLAHSHNGQPLSKDHGGPARLVIPHLYFWKSAKWVHGINFIESERPGFWEMYGYHLRGDPWKEERYS